MSVIHNRYVGRRLQMQALREAASIYASAQKLENSIESTVELSQALDTMAAMGVLSSCLATSQKEVDRLYRVKNDRTEAFSEFGFDWSFIKRIKVCTTTEHLSHTNCRIYR